MEPAKIPTLLEQALHLHEAGDFEQAEGLYRAILAAEPRHFVAVHQLGVLCLQRGEFAAAKRQFLEALALAPKSALAHFNLGNAYLKLLRFEEALTHFHYSLALNPQQPEVLLNAAVALRGLQRFEDALGKLERLLGLQALPEDVWLNRGIVLMDLKRWRDALESFDRLLALQPSHLDALMNRGVVLLKLGLPGPALQTFDAGLASRPEAVDLLVNRAAALLDLGRPETALASLDQALALQPQHALALSSRSVALRALNRNLEALESCHRALLLEPTNPEILLNQGTALFQLGRPREAIASFDQALQLQPDFAAAHSNRIFVLDYLPDQGFPEHQAARRAFYQAQAAALPPPNLDHPNRRDPDRPLVLGYVSADFKHHSAASCFGPVLKHHDKTRFKVICYSGVVREDDWTARFRDDADAWRSTLGLTDEALAAQIRQDQVDILIDLSGHSQDSRLTVFMRKPAPVQVSAWGNGGGTGIPLIDYHFTDPVFTPPWARALFAEASYDLPCCITFGPPPDLPEIGSQPATANGFITFGSFNRFNKITPDVLALWARILAAVPRSRILIKSSGLEEAATQRAVAEGFQRHGIDRERLLLRGTSSHLEHLLAHTTIDIALDTFPQNGGVTTWEALWMGVPVLTVLGNSPPGRLSGAILQAMGLGDWVCGTEEEYLQLAILKAGQVEALDTFRRGIRERIRCSPAGNPGLYTHAVEQAYRAMWSHWLSGAPGR